MDIVLTPIGWVRSPISGDREDYWGDVVSTIELNDAQVGSDAVSGLVEFSHIEVLFHLGGVSDSDIVRHVRHPRNNPQWPKIGILAQRAKARHNRIAATICELVEVQVGELIVRGLDAFDGSPVLDIKPVFAEFLPEKDKIVQPQWSHEMMRLYFEHES